MTIRFLDLSVEYEDRVRYGAAMYDVMEHGQLLNGPEVAKFEREVSEYCGVKETVGVGSGTSALYVALKAMGISQGHEVILPVLSFPGSANGIVLAGAKPVFVDVRDDMLIDPLAVDSAITTNTAAIMPIHFTGHMCDMPRLWEIASYHQIFLIEDAAPAFGASLNARRAGSWGHAGCFSMNTMKILASLGEAGCVTTNLEWLAEKMRYLRYHGIVNKDTCLEPSMNNRMDTIHAAVLSLRLQTLSKRQQRRLQIAKMYNLALAGCVKVPTCAPNIEHAWCHYTIRCDRRDNLASYLASRDIETRIYHPKIMVEHPAYKSDPDAFPVAKKISREILCLPMYHKLTDSEVYQVIGAVREFYGEKAAAA